MSLFSVIIEFALHIDKHMALIIDKFGVFSYAIIFLVIFLETAFVFTPFLPGDSLLFAAGAFAAVGSFNIIILLALLSLAAILGDSLNYSIGHFLGKKILNMKSRIIKKEYVERTQNFFTKYGNKTIVLARFVPIVRTFAPFLAGFGNMKYFKFLSYNIIGGIAWVALFLLGGFFFGNLPFVKENFSLAILIIVVVSTIPLWFELIKHAIEKKKAKK